MELGHSLVIVAAYYFLWQSIYLNSTSVATYTLAQMVTYVCITRAFRAMNVGDLDFEIYSRVRSGTVAVDLLRPIGFIRLMILRALGRTSAAVLWLSMPIVVFGIAAFGVALPASFGAAMLFCCSGALSLIITLLLTLCIGLVSFWWIEIGYILWAKTFVISFFSGALLPIAFFPLWLKTITFALPFHTMVHVPLQIYLGRMVAADIWTAFAAQLIWLGLLYFVTAKIMKFAYRQLEVQGG
ncbi:ABC transporter permease [Planctomycetota bacterium]